MKAEESRVFISDTALKLNYNEIEGDFTTLNGKEYYKISNYDRMPPFFINIVSSSDLWMFISSSGGITAGRVDADNALFPYYTVDKITENHESVGHKTILLVGLADRKQLWEPFSMAPVYSTERNLYKSIYGDEIIFEETNHDLKLIFRYSWKTSEKYGFILEAGLNYSGTGSVAVQLLSGILNILPWGASVDMQRRLSNLLDAYKLNELDSQSELGIFGFSAKVTDLAEPSESLKATTVWQYGIEDPKYLLSAGQLNSFRMNGTIYPETRVQGERGAFLINGSFNLKSNRSKTWMITAEVCQDHSAVIKLKNQLTGSRADIHKRVLEDCVEGTNKLRRIICGADGLQLSNDKLSSVHHFANTLYNTMRGGTFFDNYRINKSYLIDYLLANNKNAFEMHSGFISELPDNLTSSMLLKKAEDYGSPDLNRLCRQYLPLFFSRRHGDPSRPWNIFSIQLKEKDGTAKLDYQGNWRDIFQNWEALALSYPEYIESMIFRFLNATTPDGYNPYRIHLSGVDWEKPDPNDPWINIGYWSDHQIIYLQKLLELSQNFHPDRLHELLNKKLFVHTDVPYRIKSYYSILNNPYDSIEFDNKKDSEIESRVEKTGADGQLVCGKDGQIVYFNMVEKLLVLLLAKISNFIPGGGLWMNTQRPEWNDANNALAGKGLSVVSICYIRRYLSFLHQLFITDSSREYELSKETHLWLNRINSILVSAAGSLSTSFSNKTLKEFMNRAGQAAEEYRTHIYHHGFSMEISRIDKDKLLSFFNLALEYVDHCIINNRRKDGLYHSYNILSYDESGANVSYLYEMLEGQVAVLSSGLLKPEESLQLLQDLRSSKMYRKDQHSYTLYPNRIFPGFLERNAFTETDAAEIGLIAALEEARNTVLVSRDENGDYHFNGDFHNVKDLRRRLEELRKDERFSSFAEEDSIKLEELFIRTFNHQEFTGRSGTFFGYEGLGSIYWHMVSKLLLAVQEAVLNSIQIEGKTELADKLAASYYDIRKGLGFNKRPEVYGAFPADPYSHTPAGKGAKQPGMTGQVKEEIITRLAELGLVVKAGEIRFLPFLTRTDELIKTSAEFAYYDVNNAERSITVQEGALVFTFCQVPFMIKASEDDKIIIEKQDGSVEIIQGSIIPANISSGIFQRNGDIIKVTIKSSKIAV